MVQQLSATDVSARLQRGDELLLLDVREPSELRLAALDGVTHIPMNAIPQRAAELPKDKEIVVLCHHGVRSMQVALYLERLGFDKLYNLRGGIDAWSRDVDPTIPIY
jgi:rhodanese-related sulfurtransferase